MTEKELEKKYKECPEIIVSSIKMNEANEYIPIYEGDFKLEREKTKIEVSGVIFFDWFPSSCSKFSGTIKDNTADLIKAFHSYEKFDLVIGGLKFGHCFITNATFGSTVSLEGTMIAEAIKGDKSIVVSKVIFTVPNLRNFFGLSVKEMNDKGITLSKNRLRFENDDYIILLDKSNDYKSLIKSLHSKGGYIVLYSGEATKKKGNISFENSQKLLHCFSTFLSFLNGRKCAPLFRQGLFENQVIWYDYTSYLNDQYKTVTTWPQKYSIEELNELWQRFSAIWKNGDGKDFLISAIHWYNEANSLSGFTEGSIIMTQAALELVYNWLLIENKKLLIGKDAENISTSNKIRLLLSHINLSHEIPNAFTELQSFDGIIDGPDAFVRIRNAIVHSQEEKRKKITNMHNKAKYEALQLGIWYIELLILYILNFNGIYFNRCSGAFTASKGEQNVPWANKKD